jgi:hypothetical protein
VDGISNEGTSNTISVDFHSADGKRVGRANKTNFANTSPDSCAWETNPVFETILSAPATKIRVRNNGNDAFMVDKIWLLKGGERVETYGKNDSNGWCLSTDPNDENGNWKGYVSIHRNYGKPQASCVKDIGFNY